MASVFQLDTRLQTGGFFESAELDQWIMHSDISNAGAFFAGDPALVIAAAKRIAVSLVNKHLNHGNVQDVPLRTKTKICLILNNFALYKPVQPVMLEALDGLTSIFEKAIKEEGTMPFDSELGRMSEHVLALLMRVTGYKLKAAAVHEFAEGNTQFAIQLLLAILLKEPPYEFNLRCNCISALLGFTQPQAFFDAGAGIEEHSCNTFTEKVDFMLNLMLRLQAIQVTSGVLSEPLAVSDEVAPVVQVAVNNMMRCVMNIFKFSSKGSTQWRQHILLSTTFLDGTVILCVQSLTSTLQMALQRPQLVIPGDLLHSLSLAFKFGSFCTYHMGESAQEVRLLCTFFHDLLQLSIRPVAMNPQLSGQFMVMYVNLFHFMCNVDALAGDSVLLSDELLPELTSQMLQQSIRSFLNREVGQLGVAFVQAWHNQFRRVDTDVHVAQDSVTFQQIDGMFAAMAQPQTAAPAAPAAAGRLLGEVPSLKPNPASKVSIEKAAAPVKTTYKILPVTKVDNTAGVDRSLLCALTGAVMKHPVTSPYGHTFEKDAIHSWLEQNGSVCPITGKPLSASQLQPNKAVAAKVMQQMVKESMQSYNQENESDLYDF